MFLWIGLLIYAVIDCSRTPEGEVPQSLSRAGWLVLIILLPFLGPVFWLIGSRAESGAGAPRSGGSSASSARTRGPVGPDDDPDFLRRL